ncbi:MAG: hypothetical protein KGI08_10890, partial [Thaumarchaeota archaeon]|nr:hypothetical protein [Nitrososphaerota archaeon]
ADAKRHGTTIRQNKITSKDAIEICHMALNKISAKIIAEKFNINRNTVTEILRGEIWKYVTKDLTPISNLHYKFHLLTESDKELILDLSKSTTEIGKILGHDRHTILRWRRKLS